MKFAIIAAGEGSRLAAEGIEAPKPLVRVGGEHLVDRLIRIFADHNAEEIVVICNDRTPLIGEHLRQICEHGLYGRSIPLKFIVKTTLSSMHSLSELSVLLGDSPFVLTTVDTIFREDEFGVYIRTFEEAMASGFDGVMGVTDYIDDEKPLYVGTDKDMNIDGFYDTNSTSCTYISAGIYGLTHRALKTLHDCMERGESRMRNFQRGLIRDGRRLRAYNFSKVLDIDHASDLAKAEQFLESENLMASK